MVWALGLTQVIGYGTLYYSFGTLAPAMAREFGWSEEWVFGLLSASLLVGGLVAPLSGRLADRHGATQVMTVGSIAAALALCLAALAPNGLVFAAGLVAVEVASAFVLYATAFAALAQASATGAQRSITHLTLIAGFASTIFWPVTAALHEVFSWRDVYLIYGAINLLVCVPVHLWLAWGHRARTAGRRERAVVAGLVPAGRERRALVLMLTGFALVGFVSSAITVHMVPMLGGLGAGEAAAIVALLFGPAQVLSRLVNMQFGKGVVAADAGHRRGDGATGGPCGAAREHAVAAGRGGVRGAVRAWQRALQHRFGHAAAGAVRLGGIWAAARDDQLVAAPRLGHGAVRVLAGRGRDDDGGQRGPCCRGGRDRRGCIRVAMGQFPVRPARGGHDPGSVIRRFDRGGGAGVSMTYRPRNRGGVQ